MMLTLKTLKPPLKTLNDFLTFCSKLVAIHFEYSHNTAFNRDTFSSPEYILQYAGKRTFLLNYLFFLAARGQQETPSVISQADSHSFPSPAWQEASHRQESGEQQQSLSAIF